MATTMEPSSQELATLERCGSPEMAGRFSARVRGRLFAIQRVDMDLSPGMPHTTSTLTTALIS
jgi:hypothetical protein